MAELQSCNSEEINIMSSRFSELNGYSSYDDVSEQNKRFTKIYHIFYALRTLVSLQGFKVMLGSYTLPFKDVNPNILASIQAVLVQDKSNNESIEITSPNKVTIKKNSKRKRSKA